MNKILKYALRNIASFESQKWDDSISLPTIRSKLHMIHFKQQQQRRNATNNFYGNNNKLIEFSILRA